tara:strand:+ start:48 stop:569 length:522 start_codon:yes stop_codon:yes gene_type:complete
MKKLILISILFYNYSFTQEYLEWKDRTVSPVVIEVNDLSAQEIYQRISSWVDDTYVSPKKVLMVDKSDKVRIRGISVHAFKTKGLGQTFWYNLQHTLTIDIKEGKYRLTYEPEDILTSEDVPVMWDLQYYYNKKGKLRMGAKEMPGSFNNYLKGLTISINDAVSGLKKKDDDW